jgi:hypothetical protein
VITPLQTHLQGNTNYNKLIDCPFPATSRYLAFYLKREHNSVFPFNEIYYKHKMLIKGDSLYVFNRSIIQLKAKSDPYFSPRRRAGMTGLNELVVRGCFHDCTAL